MKIKVLDPYDKQALSLLDQSDELMASLYPAESNHLEGPEVLKKPNVLFVGAYIGDELAGCGAVKILSDDNGPYGEIKRVFLSPKYRRKGFSIEIMNYLENHLQKSGVWISRLEMGAKQPEALGLYKKFGYTECGPFGAYCEDPLSLFMEKKLGTH